MFPDAGVTATFNYEAQQCCAELACRKYFCLIILLPLCSAAIKHAQHFCTPSAFSPTAALLRSQIPIENSQAASRSGETSMSEIEETSQGC
jgi:hypothetical protein